MRHLTFLVLATLPFLGCQCGPPQNPTCQRFPSLGVDLRLGEPYFENTTVSIPLAANTAPPCTSSEQWRLDVTGPDNATVPASADGQNPVTLRFEAQRAGAYHGILEGNAERYQFTLNIARDRRDAGFVDLPESCLDVQRTNRGTWLCFVGDAGTTAFGENGSTVAHFASAVAVAGDAVWSWAPDAAVRFLDDGGCFYGADGGCSTGELGVAATRIFDRQSSAIAPDEDTLHIARIQGSNGGRLMTFRSDGGSSQVFFTPYKTNSGFAMVSAGDSVVLVGTDLRDAMACHLPVDTQGAIVSLDAGDGCTPLVGGTPVGQTRDGFFTHSSGTSTTLWKLNGASYSVLGTALSFQTTGNPPFPVAPRQSWNYEASRPGATYNYAFTLEGTDLLYEVYSTSQHLTGVDESFVWSRSFTRPETRVYFR